MKAKTIKKGRPPVKDKKVPYTFTVIESTKKAALKKESKEFIDDGLRNILYRYANDLP